MAGGKNKDYSDTGTNPEFGTGRPGEENGKAHKHDSRRDRPVVVKIPPVTQGSTAVGAAEKMVDDLFKQLPKKLTDKPAELPNNLSQVTVAKKVAGTGVTQYEYLLKPLSGTTPTPGGLSVSQTSLSERAHAAFADAEKRLGALKPMQTPKDPEDLDARKAVVLSTYKRLVHELGRSDGPRATRVDKYFHVLIGEQPDKDYKLIAGSHLRLMEVDFGLEDPGVNTPEDSANVANFRIVKENLFDVFRSWSSFKTDAGTDYVQLAAQFSRKLASIESDVKDVETAMDEFGLEASDREVEPVPNSTETIDGVLSWIKEFATQEAPELVESGGRIGVKATMETLKELGALVLDLEESTLFKNTDVQPSLSSLKERLNDALGIADRI